LRKELLSICVSVFKQLETCEGQLVALWNTHRELRSMRDIIPMIVLDVGAPLSPCLFCDGCKGSTA